MQKTELECNISEILLQINAPFGIWKEKFEKNLLKKHSKVQERDRMVPSERHQSDKKKLYGIF